MLFNRRKMTTVFIFKIARRKNFLRWWISFWRTSFRLSNKNKPENPRPKVYCFFCVFFFFVFRFKETKQKCFVVLLRYSNQDLPPSFDQVRPHLLFLTRMAGVHLKKTDILFVAFNKWTIEQREWKEIWIGFRNKCSPSQNFKQWNQIFGSEDLAKTTASLREESSDEFEVYHELRSIPFAVDGKVANPLNWWKSHHVEFPKLAKLARRFLCIIASSVPCERVFSKSGLCVSKRRTLLSDENVSNLVFIASNLWRTFFTNF